MFVELNRAIPLDHHHKSSIFSKICFNIKAITSISKDRIDEDICHVRIDGIWMAVAARYEDLIQVLGAIPLEDVIQEKPSQIKKKKTKKELA